MNVRAYLLLADRPICILYCMLACLELGSHAGCRGDIGLMSLTSSKGF